MSTPKKTASKTGKPIALPTVQQVERLCLDFMIASIEDLAAIRCKDTEWRDIDIDTDMVTDLALSHLKRMRDEHDSGCLKGDFDSDWWSAASAINLGHKAFSQPDSFYGRTLSGLVRAFEALSELPGFVENLAWRQDKQADQSPTEAKCA